MNPETACKKKIVDALVERVVADATGTSVEPYRRWTGPAPSSRFWLGWLEPESGVALPASSSSFSGRFRPASQGMSFKVAELPVTLNLSVSLAVWPVLHPSFEEQKAGSGLGDADDDDAAPAGPPGPDRREPLARVRTKVATGVVPLRPLLITHAGELTADCAEIDAALASALGRMPMNMAPYRPALPRQPSRPLTSDLFDARSWQAWVDSSLGRPVLPRWHAEVDTETRALSDGSFEVTVIVVNRSPSTENQWVDDAQTRGFPRWAADPVIYEVVLRCDPPVRIVPYMLEQIPKSYRYDREVTALGVNCAVEGGGAHALATAFAAVAETDRVYPRTRGTDGLPIDTTFASLAADPLPVIDRLAADARAWHASHWSAAALDHLAAIDSWTVESRDEAAQDAIHAAQELDWVERGIVALRADAKLLRAFRLTNQTMTLVAGDRYNAWRPFQLAFILGCLPATVDPASDTTVDILWFATGGGKTEAYLGLNLVHLFYGRLCGINAGARTWARFPLRLLSLQQTQRFADSVLLGEAVRRTNQDVAHGEPFGVGYYAGSGNTPNSISLPSDRYYNGWDPTDQRNLESCRVIEKCPVCRAAPNIRFDGPSHTLVHECKTPQCELRGVLPVWVVDDDIYRWVPSVIVGTVDKLAQLGQSAGFRKLMGSVFGRCRAHGYSGKAGECDRFGCKEPLQPVGAGFGGIVMEIQDELHLLSESLGALDGNYETLFQAVSAALGTPSLRVIGATATIEGYKEQADHLYRRTPRRFPLPGPTKEESFWALEESGDPLRTFAAMLPRGTTMLNAAFYIAKSHRAVLSDIQAEPAGFCVAAGLPAAAATAASSEAADTYEVLVGYALRKQDLERFATDVNEDRELCPTPESYDSVTGDRDFWNVREVLNRLEHPPANPFGRIRILGATSAISHGVDVSRLNAMVVMGMPTSTSEFIQSTARVGRTHPGVVFALINPMRERDVSHFRYFRKYAEYLDRLVERVPVNRESLPVLRRVLPGGFMAWILQYYEPIWMYPGGRAPARRRDRLWHTKGVAQALDYGVFDQPVLVGRLRTSFDIDGADPRFELHRQAIDEFVRRTVGQVFLRRSAGTPTKDELEPAPPRSLRDTESSIEIRGEDR